MVREVALLGIPTHTLSVRRQPLYELNALAITNNNLNAVAFRGIIDRHDEHKRP